VLLPETPPSQTEQSALHPVVQAIEVVVAPSHLWHCFWFQVLASLFVPDKQVQPSLMATALLTVLLCAGVPAHVPPLQPSLVKAPVQVCPAACASAATIRAARRSFSLQVGCSGSLHPSFWNHE
jgi:hypothetical protein